jgi:hypothetical protein
MKTPVQNIIHNLEEIKETLIFDHSRELFKSVIKIVKGHEEQEKQRLIQAFKDGEIDFNKCEFQSAEEWYNKTYGLLQ